MSLQTYDGFDRDLRAPPLKTIYIGLHTATEVDIATNQEKWLYLNGNENKDVKLEDCLPWNTISMKANCNNKCVPVVLQNYYNNQPICQSTQDHKCMMNYIYLGVSINITEMAFCLHRSY